MILLVTHKNDLTADFLIRRMEERRLPVFRFNTEDFLSTFTLNIAVSSQDALFSLKNTITGTELTQDLLEGAYFRKPSLPKLIDFEHNSDLKIFAQNETAETLRSLWRMIPLHKWLNHPEALWLANNKVKQLLAAKAVGFGIPDTLISCVGDDVCKFYDQHACDAITKPVKNGFVDEADTTTLMFTAILDGEDIATLRAAPVLLPAIYQPRLHKKLELRVTVVGQQVFAAAIFSQEHDATSLDWRTWGVTNEVALRHETCQLPVDIEQKCLELNRILGLQFSCIDLVLTDSGQYIFLEANPNGQWAWIEQMLQLPIRDAIIDQLCFSQRGGKTCSSLQQ